MSTTPAHRFCPLFFFFWRLPLPHSPINGHLFGQSWGLFKISMYADVNLDILPMIEEFSLLLISATAAADQTEFAFETYRPCVPGSTFPPRPRRFWTSLLGLGRVYDKVVCCV